LPTSSPTSKHLQCLHRSPRTKTIRTEALPSPSTSSSTTLPIQLLMRIDHLVLIHILILDPVLMLPQEGSRLVEHAMVLGIAVLLCVMRCAA